MKHACWLFIILFFSGCAKKGGIAPLVESSTGSKPAPPIAIGATVTYLALGDSYTYGVGAPTDQSYPDQLAALLTAQNYKTASPVILAHPGWKVNDLLSAIPAANVTQKFDFVTLLIGVNDQVAGTNTETYAQQFDQLLSLAISYANGYGNRVFVISIPDWSVTPFAAGMDKSQISAGVALYNSINMGQCKKYDANYIDISTLSAMAAADSTLTSNDGLHPSAKMYGLWANQFYGTVVATFK